MKHFLFAVIAALALSSLPCVSRADDLRSGDFPIVFATPSPEKPSVILRAVMYVAEGVDASVSGSAERRFSRWHEINPIMRPFAHGGAPMYALGFAVNDLLNGALFRRANVAQKNAGAASQIASDAWGIITILK